MTSVRHLTSAAILLCAVAAAGCTATASMSVEDYAREASTITEAYVAETQQLSYSYQQTVRTEVDEIVASGSDTAVADATSLVRSETVQYLALLDDAIVRYVDALDELSPPDAVAEAHDAYVAIIESVRTTLPAMRDAVGSAESIDGIQTGLVGAGFSDGQAAWVARCTTLEQAVRDEGRGIDLKCVKRDILADGSGQAP